MKRNIQAAAFVLSCIILTIFIIVMGMNLIVYVATGG